MGRGKVKIEGSPSHRCRFSSPIKSNTRTTPLQLAHIWLHFTKQACRPSPIVMDWKYTGHGWTMTSTLQLIIKTSPLSNDPGPTPFRFRSSSPKPCRLCRWTVCLEASLVIESIRRTTNIELTLQGEIPFFSSFLSACQVSQRRGLRGLWELWDDGQLVVRTSSELGWIAGCFVKIIDEH